MHIVVYINIVLSSMISDILIDNHPDNRLPSIKKKRDDKFYVNECHSFITHTIRFPNVLQHHIHDSFVMIVSSDIPSIVNTVTCLFVPPIRKNSFSKTDDINNGS